MQYNPNGKDKSRSSEEIVDIPEDIVDIPEEIVDIPPSSPVPVRQEEDAFSLPIAAEDASLYGDETDDVFLRREKRRKKEQRARKKAEKAEKALKLRQEEEAAVDIPEEVPALDEEPYSVEQTLTDSISEEEASIYGDEADDIIMPRKKRRPKKEKPDKAEKKAQRAARKEEKRARKAAEKAAKRSARNQEEEEELFSEKKFRRHFSIFEFMSRAGKSPQNLKKGTIQVLNWHVSFPVFFACLLVLALAVVIFVDDHTITVSEVSVPVAGLDASLEGYRVLVISDLNGRSFGEGQATLLNKLKNVKYDIVLFLGDMVGEDGDVEPFLELVEGIGASKVYFIPGDNDPGPMVGQVRDILGTLEDMVLEDWILAAMELGATYVDSPVSINVGEGTVWLSPATLLNVNASTFLENQQDQEEQETGGMLSGLASDYASLPLTAYRKQIAQEMYDAVQEMRAGDLHISLAHEVPADDVILSSQSHLFDDGKYMIAPDAVVAGHYCGGVWRVPFMGALYAQSSVLPRYGWFPDDARVCGLYSLEDVKVYITRGLSTNGDVLMPFRINNRPEISILTFQSTSSGSMLG